MARHRLRVLAGAAREIGWMLAGIAAVAAAFALILGIVNFAQNEATSSHVDEVQRSVVKISVCAEHPHSKLCLKGITRAVKTCLEDSTCHALLATGIRGPISRPEAFRGIASALLPVVEEQSRTKSAEGGNANVGLGPESPSGSMEQQHVEGGLPSHHGLPREPEPQPTAPAVPAPEKSAPRPPQEERAARDGGGGGETQAILPILPGTEVKLECHITAEGIDLCGPEEE